MTGEPGGSVAARAAKLKDLVFARLFEILERGLEHPKDPERRLPPPPAYLVAALRLLKECGAFGGAEGDPAADALVAALSELPEFDDDAPL